MIKSTKISLMNNKQASIPRMIINCIITNIMTIICLIFVVQIGQESWWDFGWLGHNKDGMYCERVRSHDFLKERSNSISNILFVLIGEIVLFFSWYDISIGKHPVRQNLIMKCPIWSVFYGLSLIYLGIGSFMYHASLKHVAQILDVAAIYAILLYFHLLLICKFVEKYTKENHFEDFGKYFNLTLCGLLLVLDLMAFKYKGYFNSMKVLPISAGIIIFKFILFYVMNWEMINRYNLFYGLSALLFIVTGFISRQIDLKYCNPDSWFQLHSLFHILVAVGLFLAYLMLRAERQNSISDKGVEIDDFSHSNSGRKVLV